MQRSARNGLREYRVIGLSSIITDILSAGPSVPPNSAHTLSSLPNEMLASIIASIDQIGHHSLRLTSKALRASVGIPPLMTHEEYVQFNRGFEAHSARKLKNLLCSHCNVFKKSMASKTTLSDAQAAQNLNGRRACIDCGIANGHYDRRNLVIKRKKLFVCGGCKLMLTHDKEEVGVQDVVITKAFPYRDYAFGRAAEITFDDGGKRWCKQCRMVIAGLGEGRTMKVKQVRAT